MSSHLRIHSPSLAHKSCVVVASEPLDDSADWRPLRSGELIHAAPNLPVSSQLVVDGPPPHPLDPQYAPTGGDANKREQERGKGGTSRELRPH